MAGIGKGVEASFPTSSFQNPTNNTGASFSINFLTDRPYSQLFAAYTSNGYATSAHSWTAGWTQIGIATFASGARQISLYVKDTPVPAGSLLTFGATETAATGMAGGVLEVSGIATNAFSSIYTNVGTTIQTSGSHLLAGGGTGTSFPNTTLGPAVYVSAFGASASLAVVGKAISTYMTAGATADGADLSVATAASNSTSIGIGAAVLGHPWSVTNPYSSYAAWNDNSLTSRTGAVVTACFYPFAGQQTTMGAGS